MSSRKKPNIVFILNDNIDNIDNIDQTDLLLGKIAKGPRDHVIAFIKEELAALKWKQFKVPFVEFLPEPGRHTRIELNNPQLFNVEQDPKEMWDIMEPNAWIAEVTNRLMREFHSSVATFPHVPPRGAGPGQRGNIRDEKASFA